MFTQGSKQKVVLIEAVFQLSQVPPRLAPHTPPQTNNSPPNCSHDTTQHPHCAQIQLWAFPVACAARESQTSLPLQLKSPLNSPFSFSKRQHTGHTTRASPNNPYTLDGSTLQSYALSSATTLPKSSSNPWHIICLPRPTHRPYPTPYPQDVDISLRNHPIVIKSPPGPWVLPAHKTRK